ncbi:hypothetical protein Rsub_07394 [Raphidocelis subcapitata]|uniref:Protein kinase domain-containing protein n=1 Tax=Raphidocelis subcapitata TaxID=307507 RepID=A0A2V0P471_9CHLO|nr:hypothetical protein Rsub_07394 [Raphidocelis subcapitata]|eukprot:GBF94658.1 hypothetical protein Rsub_07394 [Raphidocelis subcapitata]
MGACVSTSRGAAVGDSSCSVGPASTSQAFMRNLPSTAASDSAECERCARLSGVHSSSSGSRGGGADEAAPGHLPLETLLQVHEFQSSLAAVSEAPGLGLSEAAELLLRELGAAIVGIYGFQFGPGQQQQQQQQQEPDQEQQQTAVLLAACGAGADVLERFPVVASADWSCLRMRASGADALPGCAPAGDGASDGGSGAAGDSGPLAGLPLDWRLLHSEAGLCGFLSVPIGAASRPWGALVLASRERDGATAPAWRTYPRMAAVALVHQVRHWQTAAVCTMLREAAATDDSIALIGALLRGVQAFMQRATAARCGARIAFVDDHYTKALLLELASPTHQSAYASAPLPSVSGGPAAPPVVAMELGLAGTLLASALISRKARFVRDCAVYLQSSAAPARDIFTQPAELVSSLVVVPFVRGGGPPLAALYLSLEAPNDFTNVQEPLLGLINWMAPTVNRHLVANLGAIWGEASAVRNHSTRLRCARRQSDGGRSSLSFGGAARPLSGRASSPEAGMLMFGAPGSCIDNLMSSTASSSEDSLGHHEAPSSRLASCNGKRLCTAAIVKVVEQEILKCKRLSCDIASHPDASNSSADGSGDVADAAAGSLLLSEMIGAGGYGAVWRGSWKKVTAAIKVMHLRGCEAEAVMDAVEMAVMSAVSHPHVVQVYACLTEMVEAGGLAATGSFLDVRHAAAANAGGALHPTPNGSVHGSEPGPRLRAPRYRRLLPFEDPEETATCNIIVMEYCDLGTLRVVTQRGLFHRRLSPGPHAAVGVDLAALLEVSLQVAEAVAHLHSLRLVHCDIKLDNVLLKTEVSQPRGYIAKLGDFGLARVLGPSGTVLNAACAGTVNHLAPELFVAGSAVTTAADAYAFGVLMWELYTGGGHAHAGLGKEAIVEGVARGALRPRFPAGTPCDYAELAAACWSAQPAARPHFPAIIAALHGMLNAVSSATSPVTPPRRA